MVILHKLILGNRYLRYTSFWWWWRLMSHEGFRFDDYHIWGEFWHSLNAGWQHLEYVNEFEKYWGKGSYPPEKIILPKKDFDALVDRLNAPPDPEVQAKIKRVLERKAPWDEEE